MSGGDLPHFHTLPPKGSGRAGPEGSSEQGSCPCSSPATKLGRADPISHPGSTEELTLDVGIAVSLPCGHQCEGAALVCYEVILARERSFLLPVAFDASFGGTVGPKGVMSVGHLALLLTYCSTLESRPCTSLGQYRRANPDDRGMNG